MIMEFEIVKGVYRGPKRLETNLNLFNDQRLYSRKTLSLGLLEEIGGNFATTKNPEPLSIVNLKRVEGNADLSDSRVTDTDKLEYVKGDMELDATDIPSFLGLKECKEIWLDRSPLPYMPKLDPDTKIVWEEAGDGLADPYHTQTYGKLAAIVAEAPGLELVNLRSERPTLRHLIDHRLKGI